MTITNSRTTDNAVILIVDSVAATRHSLSRLLTEAGQQVSAVENAAEALPLLGHISCQVVLLAADLPEIDGLALCRVLRAQQRTKPLRILVYGASGETGQELAAFAAGADDFLAQPWREPELLARIQAHLASANREKALGGRNRELEFIADLGRSLLRATRPEEVVRRLAAATFEGLSVPVCAAFLSSPEAAPQVHGFDRQGRARSKDIIQTARVQDWLASPAGMQPARLDETAHFLLCDAKHRHEYVVPLIFDDHSNGLLVIGYDSPADFGPVDEVLAETAAHQAAMAAHIATLYVAAQESSLRLGHEVAARTAEIEAQRRLTEAIVDSLPVSLYAIDESYNIVAWNRPRESGGIVRSEALNRNVFSVLQRQSRDVLENEFARVFATGEITRIEEKTIDPDSGAEQHWLISKVPMRVAADAHVSHVITIGENITARVKAQRAIARADKLAAVGRLAAGVVHEINNPLATISACAEALAGRVAEGAFDQSYEITDLRDYLELIRSEVFRCKGITTGLLDFSRVRSIVRHPVYLPEVLHSAARLAAHQQHSGVDIKLNVTNELQLVTGDAGQLQQAVLALAANALDAMPVGGTLTLCAHNADNRVLVEVRDTGLGIAAENLPRIFDPFFTTKEVGSGTGLGLAVCYGIVTEHGGRLEVQSQMGQGTTFTISLPAVNFPDVKAA